MCGITISPPPANAASKLDLTGGTMTGQLVLQLASATGAVNVSPTWNNAGTNFTGIYGRVTNTASGASSCLIDLGTVAAGSIFKVGLDGSVTGPNGTFAIRGQGSNQTSIIGGGGSGNLALFGASVQIWSPFFVRTTSGLGVPMNAKIGFSPVNNDFTGTFGAALYSGSGSPEGVKTANPGSLYLDQNGGPPYYKNSGTGNTGWVLMS